MKTDRQFACLVVLLVAVMVHSLESAELEFELDATRTLLALSGTLDESSLTPQDDAGRSALTSAAGTLTVIVDNVFAPTEIRFDDTQIVLNNSGNWLPGLGGLQVETPEPANFAMKFDDETGRGWGALRGFELSIFDFDVKKIDSTFAVPELLDTVSGVLDFHAGVPFIGQASQAGTLLVNESMELAKYEITDDGAEISIPILINSVTTLDLTIEGQFVAILDLPERRGDFDRDGQLTTSDIDALAAAIRSGESELQWDLNSDGSVSVDDHLFWVTDKKRTYLGDANLDGEFNTADFVNVFQAAEYEDRLHGNSTWQTGDWNADGEFDTADFVAAFRMGGFEQGPRPLNQVPEPNGFHVLIVLFGLLFRCDVFGKDLLK